MLPADLAKSMSVWSMSWLTASTRFEALPIDHFCWTRKEEDGRIFTFGSHATKVLVVRMLVAARLPSDIQASQATELLPELGELKPAQRWTERDGEREEREREREAERERERERKRKEAKEQKGFERGD